MVDHDEMRRTGGSLEVMATLVRDPQPVEFEALLERRRRLGQDLLDEVWAGVYHVIPVPAGWHGQIVHELAVALGPLARQAGLVPLGMFNLGEADDYRVPDGGLVRPRPDGLYLPTAALVVEVVAPNDKTWNKLGFYAAHRVDELLIVDAQERQVHWLALGSDGEYAPVERSRLIQLTAAELTDRLDWPQ